MLYTNANSLCEHGPMHGTEAEGAGVMSLIGCKARARRVSWVAVMLSGLLLTACSGGGTAEPDPVETEGDAGASQTSSPDDAATSSDDGAATTDEEATVVRYGTSSPPGAMGLLTTIIADEGFDLNNGVRLEVSEFAPDQAESALLTGQVDTGFFALLSAVNSRAEGQDLVFLRGLQANHGGLLVKADSPYQSLEDLAGEKVATLNPVSGIYTSMQVLAAELGLDWEADFELVSAPPPGLVALIETDEVEAILHFEPTVSRLTSSGEYRAIMIPNDVWREQTGGPLFMLGLGARQTWVDENPETAAAVEQTFTDVLEFIAADPQVIANYGEYLGIEGEVLDQYIERMSGMFVLESNDEIRENVETILERAAELGTIPDPPAFDELFAETG